MNVIIVAGNLQLCVRWNSIKLQPASMNFITAVAVRFAMSEDWSNIVRWPVVRIYKNAIQIEIDCIAMPN
jgi:hypothetical protein